MSDIRVAMSEFRLLDDKRKLTPLSDLEEQRWMELGQLLGIFDGGGHAGFLPAAEHPQGYYADDGNWYPYPQGYDPNAYATGAPSVPMYAPYAIPDPYAAPEHYPEGGYDPYQADYYSSGDADPNGPQRHPPHAEEAGAYWQPGSAFEPNTHYGHQGGAQTSGEFHAPIGADGPIEVDPSDIMEVDAEDLIPVEPEPARARPGSAIPELSLGLDLDSPLSRPEPSPALANGRAPFGGQVKGPAPVNPREPSAPEPPPLEASSAALPDEVPLLDFSETDPN